MLKTLFTGKDNVSLDVGRVLWAGAMVTLSLLQAHAAVVLHAPFNPVTFAAGAASLLAAGGYGLKLKATTEPGA